MVSRILGAAIARVNTPQEKRKLFFLYMDEFQNFATPNLAIMLSEARVYKLALTVVSQFMDQIEDDVRKAVFSNINTQIVFQTGNFDAEFLVRVFNSPITIDDLISQPRYHAYVNTIVNSKPILPFSINTNIN